MKIRKFAAIDIGSNALRLLITNVIEEKGKATQFRKSSIIRVPIRLGEDSFTAGKISKANATRMLNAMKAFKLLMKVNKVEKYRACATSAIREANNGYELVKTIYKKSGIQIEIIDGKQEAAIIATTDLHKIIQKNKSYLYVDVGGGSTEFTLFSEAKAHTSKSFKIGTVRLLHKTVDETVWSDIEKWIKTNTKNIENISLIGSGGNINKLFKMSGRKMGTPLSFMYINSQYQYLQKLSYEERILELSLNPDRADVIIPATKIYLLAMKWSGAEQIYVPKIGLADGMTKLLYYDERREF